MTFLARLLGTVGSGGWIIYAVLAAAVFAAGASSATWVVHKLDGVTIANLRTDVANANTDAQKARTALATQQKQIALDLAEANAKALADKNVQDAKAAALTAKLAATEKARQLASTKLLDTLRSIPHDQQTALPASSHQYLRGVRDAQAAAARAAASDHPGENGLPVPDGAPRAPSPMPP